MVRTIKDVVVSLLILTITVTAWSKGEIIKIEIEGNNLSSPIEITDPDIVRRWHPVTIWRQHRTTPAVLQIVYIPMRRTAVD